MSSHFLESVLLVLFERSRDGRPEAGVLARHLGASTTSVGRALVQLERRGLVDASRVRLTMRGLAAASSLRTRRATPAERPVERAAPPRVRPAPVAERPTALATCVG